tara:strand:+ start:8797 stop:8985 length:189 start_codon:yes stop_codon:yes gene_type:complete
MEDLVLQHREYLIFVVYSFTDPDICHAFAENFKNVIDECSEVIRYEYIKQPMLRPILDIFNG